MELKGTRHLVLAWVPIIIVATLLGGLAGMAVNVTLVLAGLHVAYIDVFVGSFTGALGLIYVLQKHHIPVKGLPD